MIFLDSNRNADAVACAFISWFYESMWISVIDQKWRRQVAGSDLALQTIGNAPVSMIKYSVVYYIVTWSICEMWNKLKL